MKSKTVRSQDIQVNIVQMYVHHTLLHVRSYNEAYINPKQIFP